MSAKNLDKHNRWRNKTVAFRVSPEEDEQLEIFVKLSGLKGRDQVVAVLSQFDAAKGPDLKPEQFADFIAQANTAMVA